MDLSQFDDLVKDDKNIVNNFFKQINLENDFQAKNKVDFINDIGGLKNFKKVNKKIEKIDFNTTVHKIGQIDTKSILNAINEQIDEQAKLDFIKNYKNII